MYVTRLSASVANFIQTDFKNFIVHICIDKQFLVAINNGIVPLTVLLHTQIKFF